MVADRARNVVPRLAASQHNIGDLSGCHSFQQELGSHEGHRADLASDIQLVVCIGHATCALSYRLAKFRLQSPKTIILEPNGAISLGWKAISAMTEKFSQNELLSLTTEIVASHLSNNTVAVGGHPTADQAGVFDLGQPGCRGRAGEPEKPSPAVPIKKSVMPDYIVCLEDGKKLKMLKRHLKTRYNMTPDEYRKPLGTGGRLPDGGAGLCQQRSARWPRRSASAPSRAPAAAAA